MISVEEHEGMVITYVYISRPQPFQLCGLVAAVASEAGEEKGWFCARWALVLMHEGPFAQAAGVRACRLANGVLHSHPLLVWPGSCWAMAQYKVGSWGPLIYMTIYVYFFSILASYYLIVCEYKQKLKSWSFSLNHCSILKGKIGKGFFKTYQCILNRV